MRNGKCCLGCECGRFQELSVVVFLFLFTFHVTAQILALSLCVIFCSCFLKLIWVVLQRSCYCRMLPVILSGTALGILLNLHLV